MTRATLSDLVLTCERCGGVWADTETSERITKAIHIEIVDVAKLAAKAATDSGIPVPVDDGKRQCPMCACTLARVRTGRVMLDVCTTHGTWFDRDELGRVARNLEHERRIAMPDYAPQSQSASMVAFILDEAPP
jgi:Zn-finger nucleic acid-binding protein